MEIKKTVSTYLQKQKVELKEYTIRTSVRWRLPSESKYQCVVINVGYTIHPSKWDKELSRVKKRVTNSKYESAVEINKAIQEKEGVISTAFKKFEFEGIVPTQKILRDTINSLLGKNVGMPRELMTFQDAFAAYLMDLSKTKSLTSATYAKLKTIRNIFKEFDPNLRLDQITKDKLDEYVEYLINERGLQNGTAKKNLTFIRTFLDYCENRRLIKTDWKTHSVELKTVSGRKVVFLDLDEFNRVYNFEFPENKQYLERTRDVFCFQCLTSLRYSDVSKLKKIDILNDKVSLVTEKTDEILEIPLNNQAKAILSKYDNFDSIRALPVISNQKMNEYIKEVCYLVGLNQVVNKTYYKGKERITESFKKYELISTHTGRRTFICLALANNIPPQTVMKITGHSDYKSMQPYIDVTDQSKVDAVNIFNPKL